MATFYEAFRVVSENLWAKIRGRENREHILAYMSSSESQLWLQEKLESSELKTLSKLADVSGINKGTLSKYFRQIQRPTVDVLAILCKSLGVSPADLLVGLGALEKPEP